MQAEAFLKDNRPRPEGQISQHPLDRGQHLFFFNTAEYLTVILSPSCCEFLLLPAVRPYLGIASDSRLSALFEAAHSVMLAVLSHPQNADLLSQHLHAYVDILFAVFPQNLSPRQFRFGIKTLVRATSPPAAIFDRQPLLPSTILELLYQRIATASEAETPCKSEERALSISASTSSQGEGSLSERSILVLSLIDSLPFLPLDQLEDNLPTTATALSSISDSIQAEVCRQRFRDVMSNGEMDVARSSLCLMWWGTLGGAQMVNSPLKGQNESQSVGSVVVSGRL